MQKDLFSYRNIQKFNYINKDMFDKYKEEITNKSVIIPNGIDGYFQENPYNLEKTEKEIKLIYVGRVDDLNKNVKMIIKSCDF